MPAMNTLRACLFALCLLAPLSASAETSVRVKDAWIRVAPPGAMMLAGYAELVNEGDIAVTLNAASSDAFEFTEIHKTVEIDGVARMRQVPELVIAPGQSVRLQPGGMHFMLMRPRQPVNEGDTLVIDLLTAEGDIVPGVFKVRRGD